MTREEMREEVAQAMCEICNYPGAYNAATKSLKERWLEQADAAIAIIRGETLEEAARVAEDYDGPGIVGGYDRHLGDGYETRRDIAAAIRALGEKQ